MTTIELMKVVLNPNHSQFSRLPQTAVALLINRLCRLAPLMETRELLNIALHHVRNSAATYALRCLRDAYPGIVLEKQQFDGPCSCNKTRSICYRCNGTGIVHWYAWQIMN